MSWRRLLALDYLLVALCGLMLCRVFWVCTNTAYAQSAAAQADYDVSAPAARGDFYDRNGQRLTGAAPKWYALCVPGDSSYTRLFPYLSYAQQGTLYEKRNSAAPFLIEVDRDLSAGGVYTYQSAQRYLEPAIAVQLIGYLDGEGHGVTGLELAFDEALYRKDSGVIHCAVTAQGTLMAGTEPELHAAGRETNAGVQLTLDVDIQRACEGIAGLMMERGCINVMEVQTGELLAAVSMPEFDPRNVAKSIAADDSSLINRSFAAFNAGSVFKAVVAAAALEQGIDWYTWNCEGSTEVAGQTYRCALSRAHGTVNLRQALEQSCNCYFIHLGQVIGGRAISGMAQAMGFGNATAFAGGLKSNAGNLPDAAALQNAGQLAMLSFGQGALLATPVQITAMMNTIAAGGEYREPSLVRGMVAQGAAAAATPEQARRASRACSEQTARAMRSMLVSVVEEGIGGDALPTDGGAGGKTGTAQTGQYKAGEEQLNYWFAGFYPADEPRYTVTVLQDVTLESEHSSAEIFAAVANALHAYDGET